MYNMVKWALVVLPLLLVGFAARLFRPWDDPGHVHDARAERCESSRKRSSHAFHESICSRFPEVDQRVGPQRLEPWTDGLDKHDDPEE